MNWSCQGARCVSVWVATRLAHSAPMVVDMSTGFHFRPEGLGLLLAWNDADEKPGFKTHFDRGFIEKILFREGGDVKQGDLLFQIDPRPYQANLDQAEAELTLAEALVKLSDAEYERAKKLAVSGAMSKEEIAQTASDAVKIANRIGFPVVAKVVSAEILHKSDIGGVILNINNAAEVRKAFNDISTRVKKLKNKPKLEGILIAQQVKAELELVVGASLDAEMGPVVLFGTGGVDIELMKDVALAGAPLDAEEAKQLIGRTKAGVKLRGYRGKPALHEASAVKALVGLSNLMADAGNRIASIDVTPFLINTRTGVAVDGLIVLNNAEAESAAGH